MRRRPRPRMSLWRAPPRRAASRPRDSGSGSLCRGPQAPPPLTGPHRSPPRHLQAPVHTTATAIASRKRSRSRASPTATTPQRGGRSAIALVPHLRLAPLLLHLFSASFEKILVPCYYRVQRNVVM